MELFLIPIAINQSFELIPKDSKYTRKPNFDTNYFNFFVNKKSELLPFHPILKNIKTINLSELLRNKKNILIFSTSYEPGIPILQPDTIFELIHKVMKNNKKC